MNDDGDSTHPSWNKRLEILNNYSDFSEKVIYEVAEMCNVDKNSHLVYKMINKALNINDFDNSTSKIR